MIVAMSNQLIFFSFLSSEIYQKYSHENQKRLKWRFLFSLLMHDFCMVKQYVLLRMCKMRGRPLPLLTSLMVFSVMTSVESTIIILVLQQKLHFQEQTDLMKVSQHNVDHVYFFYHLRCFIHFMICQCYSLMIICILESIFLSVNCM